MRTRRSNLNTPRIEGDTLTYRDETPTGEVFHTLKVGSTEWFTWLEKKGSRFYFGEETHHGFTVQKESNRRGETGWVASKRKHKRLIRIEVGKAEAVTLARLHEIANEIEAAMKAEPQPTTPEHTGPEAPPAIIQQPGKDRLPPGWVNKPVAPARPEPISGPEKRTPANIPLGAKRSSRSVR